MDSRRFPTAFALVLVLPLSLASQDLPSQPDSPGQWQSTVSALADLQPKWEGSRFEEDGSVRAPSHFDVNQYFSVLDRLSMEPGWVLDYVYCDTGAGGSPRLYARRFDRQRLLACSDVQNPAGVLHHVKTDGSPEGFFQLVLLEVVGEQFYLYWHAHYDDHQVVCNREGIESILRGGAGFFGKTFSSKQKEAARRIDPVPRVELKEGKTKVEIVTFTKWGGFHKRRYELSRAFPHTFRAMVKTRLVEFQVGIIF